ncbi:MAG: YfcL family protein [Plesiomonas sp.]|uniref:YfcL family protein n=1 Tax=Plesiomonas sp. TaxID=2486279 RepID=UPI003F3DA8D5
MSVEIVEFESQILALIDNHVEQATDDELFAGGYLRGHITLAAAQADLANENTLAALAHYVDVSLNIAIANGELSPPDQQLVRSLWATLLQQITVSS